jgi:hypothetical protein
MNVSGTIQMLKGQNPSRTLVSPVHLTWLMNHIDNLSSPLPHKMVECGVARGGCIAMCSKKNPDMIVIGLDSFQGMPEITSQDNAQKCKPWVGSENGKEADVYDKVRPGGVIIFDDWHFNPEGVRTAAAEFLNERDIKVNIIPHEPGRGPAYFIKPVK